MTYLGQMMKFTIEIPIPSFFTFLVDIPQKMQTFDVKREKNTVWLVQVCYAVHELRGVLQ